MTLSPRRQELLDKVLADRSTPGTQTDYRAGTLSDEDRERFLSTQVALSRTLGQAEATLDEWPDRHILHAMSLGFG